MFHLMRAVQLDELIRHGIFFSRWAPDLVYGYGYPIFNYYPPLSYYFVELWHLLGFDLSTAFIIAFIATFVGASFFSYLWVQDIFDDGTALVAAAMYAFAPYLMINALQRGALAEQMALALLPLCLWTFHRLITIRHRKYALFALLSYTAIILAHHVTALLFTPALAVYILICAGATSGVADRGWQYAGRNAVRALMVIALGLGLTAFFWLPALWERDLVQMRQAFGPLVFNYDKNFLSLGDVFALPPNIDSKLVNQSVPISLSLIAVLAGLLGIVRIRQNDLSRYQRVHLIYAVLVVAGCVFMTLPLSSALWASFPLLEFLQFPWRFLGVGTLALAFLGGAGAGMVMNAPVMKRVRPAVPGILVLLSVVYAIPWQFMDYYPAMDSVSVVDSVRYEVESGLIGTTSTGEYLPRSVTSLPPFDPTAVSPERERLNRAALPDSVRLLAARYEPLNYELELTGSAAFPVVFNTFYFEGWTAKIDGRPVEINPTTPHGLIGVEVPAGQHTLTIEFRNTPAQRLASIVSVLTLLTSLAVLILVPRASLEPRPLSRGHEVRSQSLVALLLVLVIAAVKFSYLDVQETFFRHTMFDGTEVAGIDHPVKANFDDQLALLGLDMPQLVNSGENLEFALYWRIPQAISDELSVSAVLVDANSTFVGQSDHQHPGTIPTTRWQPDQYARDSHAIAIRPGTPPGEYTLLITVYHYGRPDERLNLLDENKVPIGQSFAAAQVQVGRPDTPAGVDEIDLQQRADVDLGNGLSLVGYSLLPVPLQAGHPVPLVFAWRATQKLPAEMELQFGLTDDRGQLTSISTEPPVPGYDTTHWLDGDVWRAEHHLLLPAALATGFYTLTLRSANQPPIYLDRQQVVAPQRTMQEPEIDFPQPATFGRLAQLVGYSLPQEAQAAGDRVPITLVWRPISETPASYKSFAHLVDASGRLVVGSDMIPGDWQRPTTSWIAGEYVTDHHDLVLPPDLAPGSYHVLVGLYDVDSLERLPLEKGGDAVTLSQSIDIAVK